MPADAPRVVAFGGGHGLAAALGAWRRLTTHLTAVVTDRDHRGDVEVEFGGAGPQRPQ